MINVQSPFVLLLIVFFPLSIFAQFEGKIIYDVSYESSSAEIAPLITSLPAQSTLWLKNERSRFTQPVAGGGEQAFVSNAADGSTILLMQFLGQSFQVRMTQSEILELKPAADFKIVEGKLRKNIAGLECRQAFAISGSDSLEIYYTPEIEVPTILPQFKQLNGLPLEYEISRNDLHIRYRCSHLSQEAVADASFEISDEVKVIPFEQFARSFALTR